MSKSRENPLINLIANVALPVFILNKLSSRWPVGALLIALAFPLGYGVWSYLQTKKINFISLLGLLNTLFTGGFALLRLDGIWFAVKEAAFPLLIGCFVFVSSFRKNPFLKMMLFETGAINTEDIDKKIIENKTEPQLMALFKNSTVYFSLTFFFSATLNFLLAYKIFRPIPVELAEPQKADLLNQQIAQMTWQGYVVIFVPSVIFFFMILFYFFRKLMKLTDLKFDQIIKN